MDPSVLHGWMKHTLDYFSQPPKERHKSYQRIIRAIQSDTSHKMIMAISHDELKEGKSLLKMTKGLSSEEELSNVRSFLGLMYTLPGKKLLFMGSDTASEETWEALIGTKKGVDDVPLSEAKKRISEMLFDLSEIYKKPAFFERDSNGDDLTWIEKNDPDRQVVAFRRTSADGRQSFACVHNFSGNHVKEFVIQLPTPGASGEDVAFKEVFNSEDKKYSGSGLTNANIKILKDATGRPYAYKIQIPPMASLIIQETQETVIQ